MLSRCCYLLVHHMRISFYFCSSNVSFYLEPLAFFVCCLLCLFVCSLFCMLLAWYRKVFTLVSQRQIVLYSDLIPLEVQKKSIFVIDNEMHRTQKTCPRSSKCHSYEITSPLPTVDVWIIHFSLTLLTLTEIHTPHKRDNFDFRNLLSRINAMSRVRYHSVGIEQNPDNREVTHATYYPAGQFIVHVS